MSARPDERSDEVLARIAAGELDESSQEARAVLERDPTARARLAELRELATSLDAAGANERATISAAAELDDAPGLERVESALRELIGPRRRYPLRPLLAAAAAIAAGTLLVVLLGPFDRDAERPHVPLGPPPIEIEVVANAPAGTLTWRFPLPEGGHYEIRVTGISADGEEEVLVPSRTTREPRWSPPAAALDAWPARILVDVAAVDASGAERGSGSLEVRLR